MRTIKAIKSECWTNKEKVEPLAEPKANQENADMKNVQCSMFTQKIISPIR